jgi:hypothetical protein
MMDDRLSFTVLRAARVPLIKVESRPNAVRPRFPGIRRWRNPV